MTASVEPLMTAHLPLADLPFSDLYVRLDAEGTALYHPSGRGKSRGNHVVPPEYQAAVVSAAAAIRAHLEAGASRGGTGGHDGSLTHEGVRYRISRQQLADGEIWVCLRRISTNVPDAEKLGFAPHVLAHMRQLGRRDGLILVAGATGMGKTTTATALLADYLRQFGGVAVTIEDPVEYVLKGRHGEAGYCFQVEIEAEEGWADSLKRALRWAPRYIFVGEIRTPRAAEQLLRAATTGHTVIATVHAGAPEEALMGLIYLAEQAMGPGVQLMLAQGLTALIYQTMSQQGPFIRYLFTEETPSDPVRSLIRENKIGMIGTYIDKIASRLNPAGTMTKI